MGKYSSKLTTMFLYSIQRIFRRSGVARKVYFLEILKGFFNDATYSKYAQLTYGKSERSANIKKSKRLTAACFIKPE